MEEFSGIGSSQIISLALPPDISVARAKPQGNYLKSDFDYVEI